MSMFLSSTKAYYLKRPVYATFAVIFLFSGTARRIRADRGTENVNIEALQKYFRSECTDAFAGDMSFIYGKSTANQVCYILYSYVIIFYIPYPRKF